MKSKLALSGKNGPFKHSIPIVSEPANPVVLKSGIAGSIQNGRVESNGPDGPLQLLFYFILVKQIRLVAIQAGATLFLKI